MNADPDQQPCKKRVFLFNPTVSLHSSSCRTLLTPYVFLHFLFLGIPKSGDISSSK